MTTLTKSDISKTIQQHIESALKTQLDATDLDKSLLDLGLNSLKALTLSSKLEDVFEIDIDPVELIDYETINELSTYIFDLINE